MFPGAPIDSAEESCGLVLDTSSSLGFRETPSFLELGFLQTSPPCGTQVRICSLSGPASYCLWEAWERGGNPKRTNLGSIYLGPYTGHMWYTGLQGIWNLIMYPGKLLLTDLLTYTHFEKTLSLLTSRIHLDPRGSSTETKYSYIKKNKEKLSRTTWADNLLVW